MAFGFLGKLLDRISGKTAKPAPKHEGREGRGRRGRHGRHASGGNAKSPQPAQPKQRPQPAKAQSKKTPPKGASQKANPPKTPAKPNASKQPNAPKQAKPKSAPIPAPQSAQPKQAQPPVAPPPPPVAPAAPVAASSSPVVPPPVSPVPDVPPSSETESVADVLAAERQVVFIVRAEDKFTVLGNLLAKAPEAKTVVFCNRKTTAQEVQNGLALRNVKCGLLSGDVNEEDRRYVQDAFVSGEISLVVVTDGFGGGVDVAAVDCLVNYDFPFEAEDYVRRMGGLVSEGGCTGRIVSFADEDESFGIDDVEKRLGVSLKYANVKEDDPLLAALDAEAAAEEPPEPLFTHIKGGIPVFDAAGREGRVVVGGDGTPRPLPTFEHALDPRPVVDETNAYVKPLPAAVASREWVVETPCPADAAQ